MTAKTYVIGTCDTKSAELHYAADLIRHAGGQVALVDVSTGPGQFDADIPATEVARFHPNGPTAVLGLTDRGQAVTAMAEALTRFILSRDDTRVLFAGDTAYTDLYRGYRDREIDLCLMPIGAYNPWIDNHANPEEAWAMATDLGAGVVLPIHHSTFRLSREPMDEPIARLLAAAGHERDRIALTEVGATWYRRS